MNEYVEEARAAIREQRKVEVEPHRLAVGEFRVFLLRIYDASGQPERACSVDRMVAAELRALIDVGEGMLTPRRASSRP